MASLVWLWKATWRSNWVEDMEERIPLHRIMKSNWVGGWMPDVIREWKRLLLPQQRRVRNSETVLSISNAGTTTCWLISTWCCGVGAGKFSLFLLDAIFIGKTQAGSNGLWLIKIKQILRYTSTASNYFNESYIFAFFVHFFEGYFSHHRTVGCNS